MVPQPRLLHFDIATMYSSQCQRAPCTTPPAEPCVRVPPQGAGGSGSFGSKRSPLGGKGLVHSDSTVQMQFHMAERMEENPRIWQVWPPLVS